MKVIVNVATGPHYVANLGRLLTSPYMADENVMVWKDELPPGSPSHRDCPYGFKIYAIEAAVKVGATSVLWLDSSTIVLKSLDPLWDLIEHQGYWFSRNYEWNNGQFCDDNALAIMRMSRADAFNVPQVTAACFGLDMRSANARMFFENWKTLAILGAFKGERGDLSGTGDMTGYIGHRNDQSCAAYICHALGLKLTDPPDWWAEQGHEQNDKTILTLER